MYCPKCGTQLPDDAVFCMKCGTNLTAEKEKQQAPAPIVAPIEAKALNCPSCGAPITPQFGEMVITCAYCGTAITLGSGGWKGIQKQTMLPLTYPDEQKVKDKMRELMDRGILHRHLQENSKLVEMNLSLVPYWIVSASARTNIVASDVAVETGQIATTAALFALIGAGVGGRRGGIGLAGPLVAGTMLGSTMGARGGARKSFEFDNNYNFPVVALKALAKDQPRDYQFNLEARTFFDVAKVPKGVKILNGDVGEEAAKYQAKALVDQLQSDRAHGQYHMIQQLHTEIDIGESELLHAPIWFARYEVKGREITLVIDANSGAVINSIGL
jgi:hypothetical protein